MKRHQAVKASSESVRAHINRQQVFGENAIRGRDWPRPVEILAVTGVALAAIAFAAHRGWFSGWLS